MIFNKYTLAIILSIVTICTSKAQYAVFLTQNKVWYVEAYEGEIWGKTYKHILAENRTFQGKDYKRYIDYSNPSEYLYFREDTSQGKIWSFNTSSNAEVLLYDFSMKKGDSMLITFEHVPTNVHTITYTYRVDSTFYVNTLIGKRKAIWLSTDNGFLNEPLYNKKGLLWIEGIGSTVGPMYNHYRLGLEAPSAYKLLCCFDDTLHTYALLGKDSCDISFGNTSLIERNNNSYIRLINAGSNTEMFAELNIDRYAKVNIDLVDMTGRCQNLTLNLNCSPGLTRIPLSLGEIHGFYIVVFKEIFNNNTNIEHFKILI
jgi:hypothetical protein